MTMPTTKAKTNTPSRYTNEGDAFKQICKYRHLLEQIGTTFGISDDELASVESVDKIETKVRICAETLTNCDIQIVSDWFGLFETDLEIDVDVIGTNPDAQYPTASLRYQRAVDRKLTSFVEEIESYIRQGEDDLMVDLRIYVAKHKVLAIATQLLEIRRHQADDLAIEVPSIVHVFYFSASWYRWLTPRALQQWESRKFINSNQRMVTILCDSEGYLSGIAFEIIGAGTLGDVRWLNVSRSAWHRFQERALQTRLMHERESSWAGAPQILTPSHLQLEERAPGLQGTARKVALMQTTLAAAFLASSVQSDANGQLIARYAGSRPTSCIITQAEDWENVILDSPGNLSAFASWAYDSGSPDKLAIARECLALELPSGDSISLAKLDQIADNAFKAAKANFAQYLRHNSERYFQLRQQAVEAVRNYAESVRKTVNELTHDVVDNVFRVGSLLVGAFVAGILDSRLTLNIQRFAVAVIGGYVLFVLLYFMRTRQRRHKLDSVDLKSSLDALSELSSTEKKTIQAPISRADDEYEHQYQVACRVYLGMCVLCAIYFLFLFTPAASAILPHYVPTLPAKGTTPTP